MHQMITNGASKLRNAALIGGIVLVGACGNSNNPKESAKSAVKKPDTSRAEKLEQAVELMKEELPKRPKEFVPREPRSVNLHSESKIKSAVIYSGDTVEYVGDVDALSHFRNVSRAEAVNLLTRAMCRETTLDFRVGQTTAANLNTAWSLAIFSLLNPDDKLSSGDKFYSFKDISESLKPIAKKAIEILKERKDGILEKKSSGNITKVILEGLKDAGIIKGEITLDANLELGVMFSRAIREVLK